MKYPIYIPTLGRVGNQKTLASLPPRIHPFVYLVCPFEEAPLHKRNHPGVNVLPCAAVGIAATRQWLVEQCEAPICTMVDDDQLFYKRIGKTVSLTAMSPEEIALMLEEMEGLCMIYPMVGLSARQGNNRAEADYLVEASRVHNHYALDVSLLKAEGIKFSAAKLMEDFYVNLSLLTRGYATAKVVDRCWNQSESNAEGGCSTYRNAELQAEAAFFLAMEFPQVVEVVEKKTKGGWFGGIRYDVKVQWKKALQIGLDKKANTNKA
jgi:hypothetical protein